MNGNVKTRRIIIVISLAMGVWFSPLESVEAIGTNILPQQTVVIGKPDSNRLIQESNVPVNVKTHPKIVLIKMKSDLTNPKWINKFIISLRGGEETLIRSILYKAGESDLDLPSINKILKKTAEAVLSVASNEKLLRLLVELERPFESKLFDGQLLPSTDILGFPKAEAFEFPGFRSHRRQNKVEWKKENKCSTPSADYLLDSTKCYGHREAYNMPRSVSERFETNAVKSLAKRSLKNPRLKKEYIVVKDLLKEGVHPVNLSEKSTYVSSTKVLVKKAEGRYIVDVSDTHADIVAVSSRTNDKCMAKFQTLMNKLYDLDLKGY